MKTNKKKRRRIACCWDSSTQKGLSREEQLEQSLFFMRIELDREALEIEILRSEGKLVEDRVPNPWPYEFPRYNPVRHHHTSVCGKVMLITSEEVYINCRLAGMTIYPK